MRAHVVSIAIALALLGPARAGAETTVSHVGSVEVIETQPDATPNPHPPKRAAHRAAAAATSVATAAQNATEGTPAGQVPALEGLPAGPGGGRPGADALIRTALSLVGTRYVWGGASTSGFDCSGFTYYAYAQLGIRIPRTADAQFASGRPITGDPLPGDLVFFQTYDYGASHVGIYLGQGRFVNSIGNDVHIASFASPYFRSRYLGARRFL